MIAANEGTPRCIAGRSLAVEKGLTEFAPRTARINLNYFSDDMRVRKILCAERVCFARLWQAKHAVRSEFNRQKGSALLTIKRLKE